MKLGLVVNKLGSRTDVGQTTYRLAQNAALRGHEVYLTSAGGFCCESDGRIRARAVQAPQMPGVDVRKFIQAVADAAERPPWVDLSGLDVLLLRNNPAVQTPWAQRASLHFGNLLVERGVIVLNDPGGLTRAANKLYLLSLPEQVRPLTLITRSFDRVRAFAEEHGSLVIKPVQGSGGQGVFVLKEPNTPNLENIFRSVARDGYVVVQEYLPDAVNGDTRVFLLNGVPLERDGAFAALRRVPSGDDPRSNVHVGARIRPAVIDDEIRAVAEAIRPRLVADGMFFVGLDVVGNKLMEVNVFSPGGLGSAQTFAKVDFSEDLLHALERKVELRADGGLSNLEIATAS